MFDSIITLMKSSIKRSKGPWEQMGIANTRTGPLSMAEGTSAAAQRTVPSSEGRGHRRQGGGVAAL